MTDNNANITSVLGAPSPSIATVSLYSESGCDPKAGEYSLDLVSISLSLSFEQIALIQDAILNDFPFDQMKVETPYTVVLRQSGEREDVFWNEYFTIVAIYEGRFP